MKKIIESVRQQIKEFAPAFGAAIAITLFVVVAASVLYRPKIDLKRGFEIKLSADGKPIIKKEKIIDFSEFLKTADASRGEKIFKKCASCHTVNRGGAAKVGPNLFGVIGRARGSMPGFAYSDAMKAKGGSWDKNSIGEFIKKPKDYLPGTKMAFPGLRKPQDRADVIAFLESQK